MVACFRSKQESLVADFAAGNGDLLRVARARWPRCRIVATDIDDSRIRALRRDHSDWMVGKCDFLNPTSRRMCRLLQDVRGRVSLVLLNPPFSCRGNKRFSAFANGQEILCSRAMAFVLTSVDFLSPRGRLAVILPAGCLTGEKDADAWAFLRSVFNVRVVESHGLKTFDGCAARTHVVCLNHLRPYVSGKTVEGQHEPCGIAVKVVRGVLPVHDATNGMAGPGWPFIHTTNLKNQAIIGVDRSVKVLRRWTRGPSVLIPRVGQPSPQKCVLYLTRKRIVPSDCVYAIECETPGDARAVHARLLNAWSVVHQAYGGTCAKYITVDGLCSLLQRLGFRATSEPRDRT